MCLDNKKLLYFNISSKVGKYKKFYHNNFYFKQQCQITPADDLSVIFYFLMRLVLFVVYNNNSQTPFQQPLMQGEGKTLYCINRQRLTCFAQHNPIKAVKGGNLEEFKCIDLQMALNNRPTSKPFFLIYTFLLKNYLS